MVMQRANLNVDERHGSNTVHVLSLPKQRVLRAPYNCAHLGCCVCVCVSVCACDIPSASLSPPSFAPYSLLLTRSLSLSLTHTHSLSTPSHSFVLAHAPTVPYPKERHHAAQRNKRRLRHVQHPAKPNN